MKLVSILHSMKQYLAGLMLRSISDDLETAVALARADHVRDLETQAARDRDDGHTQAAALLESSAGRLAGTEQAEEGFAFLEALTQRADSSLALGRPEVSSDSSSDKMETPKQRSGRPRKNRGDQQAPNGQA